MTEIANGIVWLKLDEASRARLQEAFPPRYLNLYCDHVTLAYDVAASTHPELIGQRTAVLAYAHAYNDHVQAVRVHTTDLPDIYGVPHITLSTAEGVAPYASVAMLQGPHEESPIEPPLQLAGTIEFVPLQ